MAHIRRYCTKGGIWVWAAFHNRPGVWPFAMSGSIRSLSYTVRTKGNMLANRLRRVK